MRRPRVTNASRNAQAISSGEPVTPAGSGPLIRVSDTARDPVLVALERLGVAARARLSQAARVIAITGSVGKTSTKEMLQLCLRSVDPCTHASEKSYNNHWGVPLTLARMPADTKYGVFEIGMNHGGEIRPLTKMVRPHVAIITTVGPVHLEFFKDDGEIAKAKAEIFEGLTKMPALAADDEDLPPVAILNSSNKHFDQLSKAATIFGAAILKFGDGNYSPGRERDFKLTKYGEALDEAASDGGGSEVHAELHGKDIKYRFSAKGVHQVMNSGAALLAVGAVGADPWKCVLELAKFASVVGRGERTDYAYGARRLTLIDESYNANPLSMAAALDAVWSSTQTLKDTRRIAVLGDMRELGPTSRQLHAALLQPVLDAHIDLVFACGPFMRALYDALPAPLCGGYAERSTDLVQPLLEVVRPGDVIMIKGSLGTRMAPIVEALKTHLSALAEGKAK